MTLFTLLALALMIFIHELGHYWTARRFGVGIEKFSSARRSAPQVSAKECSGRSAGSLWAVMSRCRVKIRRHRRGPALSFPKPWWQRLILQRSFCQPAGASFFTVSFLLPIKVEDHHPVVFEADGKWARVV